MKLDFESLSAEPLVYMLLHSGVFVTVLGAVFFIIGLLFGYATWGRYKRQTRELRGEAAAMKEEIAQLKRKVGEQSVKSGPAIVIATETIHMPSKEGASPAAPSAPAAPASEPAVPTVTPATVIPPKPGGNVIKPKETAPDSPAKQREAQASFSFMPDTSTPTPARHASALASIITSPPAEKKSDEGKTAASGQVPPDTIPTFTDLPALPPTGVTPEFDPKLGLTYKSRPEHADDLTALKGIAKGLEERLNALGIHTYGQIAAWNEDHVREFSARLAFKDRIQREQWVEQARQLAAKSAARPTV
jgi:predicted flap endonuclease-1-like 5' DNA nuclease